MNFARANVYKNVQLDQFADAACLSKYHFSRIFQVQVGESPGRFLKRARLEMAANLLSSHRTLSIAEIVSKCDFSSIQLFSHTVGDHFGYCPREFRSLHMFSMEHNKGREHSEILYRWFRTTGIFRDSPFTQPQIKVVKLPPTKVAYAQNFGYNSGSGKEAFNCIRNWLMINNLKTENTEIIEISWDYSAITPEELYRFEACVVVPEYYPGFPFRPFQEDTMQLYKCCTNLEII